MHPTFVFSILLCLTPDDFTCQVESVSWVNDIILYCINSPNLHTSLDKDTEPKYMTPVCKTMLGNHTFNTDLEKKTQSLECITEYVQ
jgi:hypothetical protein